MNKFLIPMLADFSVNSGSGGGLGQGLILLVVAVIVLGFLWWVVQNYVPEPMRKYAVLVLVLGCVLVLCNFVLGMNGHAFIHW
jgi:hypothetical protein